MGILLVASSLNDKNFNQIIFNAVARCCNFDLYHKQNKDHKCSMWYKTVPGASSYASEDTLYAAQKQTSFNKSLLQTQQNGCEQPVRMLSRRSVEDVETDIGGQIRVAGETPEMKNDITVPREGISLNVITSLSENHKITLKLITVI
jgi:hypothetical protein